MAAATLVGRERELAALRAAWAAVGDGLTRVVGVDGAPGTGKTALVRHFVASAAAPPWRG
ncbi:AAA family ATPase [Luedemannella flava]